jgi:hypothetical protein
MQGAEFRTPVISLIHFMGGVSNHEATRQKKNTNFSFLFDEKVNVFYFLKTK